jgi:predicted permease
MNNLILMVLCFGVGIWARQSGKMPPNAHQALNTIIVYLCLPALTLLNIHNVTLSKELALAALAPWVLFVVGAGVFFVIGKALRFSRETVGVLTLLGGLGNTSFVGVPMIEALVGKAGIPLALVIDQAGTYLVLSTLGMLAIGIYCEGRTSPVDILKKISTFPPFIAMVLAALLLDVQYPAWVESTFKRFGDMLAPLALMSVGMQMRLADFQNNQRALAAGLGFKLLVCPTIILACMSGIQVPMDAASSRVILLESAMGPQIGAGIVATQNNLNPSLVTMMIGLGVPLCLVTVPLWSVALTRFGF